jgi:hypothetical protein
MKSHFVAFRVGWGADDNTAIKPKREADTPYGAAQIRK